MHRSHTTRTLPQRAPARPRFAHSTLFALATWSARAASQPPELTSPLTLDWSAPAGCPSRDHVLERVAGILGRSTKPRGALSVRAVAAQSANGKWRVTLAVDRDGGSGTREFEAESCDAAADATALIVSLMIDPTVVPGAGERDRTREPEKTAPPAAPANPPPPRPSPPEPPPPSPALFAVRASLAGDVGTFSPAGVGGELALTVSPWRLRFELAGSYWVSSTATVPGSPSEGASLQLATLGVRAMYVLPAGDFALAPLAGVEGDRMTASGFGGAAHHQQAATWAAIDLGATGFWFPVRGWRALALALTFEAILATERPAAFVATEPGGADRVVQQSSQIASRAFLGVEYRFF